MRELFDLIRARHSARVPFDPHRALPKDAIEAILEAGRWAPTAHNMQNFEVVVVDDRALVEKLGTIRAELSEAFIRENYDQLSFSEEELGTRRTGILAAMFPPSWRTPEPDMAAVARERGDASLHDTIQDSPALFVVTYDPRTRAPASESDFLGIISLGCVMENMWLMAEALGISFQIMSVFSGEKIERQVKEMLAIPHELRIAFAVRLGYPISAPCGVRVRRELRDFAHHNRFGRHDLG